MKIFLKMMLVLLVLCLGFAGGMTANFFYSMPESEKLLFGGISFHFMELGNAYTGDSIFIQCGDYDILIDAGSRSNSAPAITSYVDQFVTDGKLEYVIATHSDRDHISAFYSTSSYEGVLDHYDVDMIIDFPNTSKENPTSSSILGQYYIARDKKVEAGTKHYTALECYNNENGAQRVYELSNGVTMEILYNYFYDHKSADENNYSVCLLFSRGDEHYLFTGDLEKEGEEKLVQFYKDAGTPLPHCKLYKAGHHGSKTSSNPVLLEAIKPEIVVVCAMAGSKEYTENNDNTFPTQIFIDNVSPYTDKVYVTSVAEFYTESGKTKERGAPLNGNIQLTFSGSRYEAKFSNFDKPLKDSDWFKNNRTCPSAWAE